jgi:HAD superfamily hydrolase (TIGR01549 family)
MTIRAVLFDMDGTVYDSGIDWFALRERIGIPPNGRPILEQLDQCDEETRARGIEVLHRAEAEGAEGGRLIDGTEELLSFLRERKIPCLLVTNNSRRSVDTVLGRHDLGFDHVLTREDGAAKPNPDLFRSALARVSVSCADALVIGDTHMDLLAAQAAGVGEVILVSAPAWVKGLIPEGVTYREARDLHHVREIVASLLAEDAPGS